MKGYLKRIEKEQYTNTPLPIFAKTAVLSIAGLVPITIV
jgi:hypothetical protein